MKEKIDGILIRICLKVIIGFNSDFSPLIIGVTYSEVTFCVVFYKESYVVNF